jgi:cytochrome c oxidase subunit 4
MANHSHEASTVKKREKQESPRNHYFTYILSILLTFLAFAAVVYGDLDRSLMLIFIIGLGVVQAIVQLLFWMHAKDKGHFFPLLFIGIGALVALTAVAAGVYWIW